MRDEILRELVESVKEVAGAGYEVQQNMVVKNNGVQLQAIIVKKVGEVVSPTVYVDKFIENIEKEEMTVSEAAEKIFGLYEKNKSPELGMNLSDLKNKDFILSHVEYQLVNAERNQDRLLAVPHKEFLDFAVMYRVVIGNNENGVASFVVSDRMMEIANITIEELDEAAVLNTKKAGFVVKTMEDILSEMIGMMEMPEETLDEIPDGPKMYVLTNNRRVNGANVILYEEILGELADQLEEDLYILPSSVHEVLAIPASYASPDELKFVVREVNNTKVSDEEILGYQVYRYYKSNKKLSIA